MVRSYAGKSKKDESVMIIPADILIHSVWNVTLPKKTTEESLYRADEDT